MNIVLERDEKGNYIFAEPKPEPATAEMHQPITKDTLKSYGLTEDQIAVLEGIKSGKGDQTANMEMSFGGIGSALDKATGFQVMGLPLGEAAVGGAIALVLDRLVLGKLLAKYNSGTWGPFINLGTAWVIKKYGSKILGSKTADAAALILTYEAVADWVTLGINSVWPATQKQTFNQPSGGGGAMRQFERVADDYYAAAMGR
jgi:hypothetical protein